MTGTLLGGAAVGGGVWSCCGQRFEFDEVVRFGAERAGTATSTYRSILVAPPQGERTKGLASSSHESMAFSLAVAKRFRAEESHAYFLQTPIGAAVHYWDARVREYKKQTLRGRDAYEMRFELGRLAWIADYRDRLPELWLVCDRPLELREAERFAREVMATLGAKAAMAYIRTDPYAWPKENGWPYSLPLQWREAAPASATTLSRMTIACDLSLPGAKAQCVVLSQR